MDAGPSPQTPALRIGQALGMTPEFWMNLQKLYDLDRARAVTKVDDIEPLVTAR